MVSVNQIENKEKRAAKQRTYYSENKDKISALNRAYYLKNRDKLDVQNQAYRVENRDKINTKQRTCAAANRETVRARRKAHYAANREKMCAASQAYKKANADKINAYRRERHRKQLKSSDDRVRSLLRGRLRQALKRNTKKGSAVRDLGCTIQAFKTYIEAQFEPGMSWNNHGVASWHFDHILPLSLFDLTNPEQVKLACHYSNLRPLWAKANLAKRDIVPGWNCPLPSEFFE